MEPEGGGQRTRRRRLPARAASGSTGPHHQHGRQVLRGFEVFGLLGTW